MTLGILPAHGIEGSVQLPVPMMYAVVGASWALTLTFVVAALAWRTPRFVDEPAFEPPGRRWWLAAVGAALTALVLGALFFGSDDHDNRGMAALYVWVWVGLVPLALFAGHVWRDLSPWRSLQAIVGRVAGRPDGWMKYPDRLGHWPAAIGLLAFAWLELASPDPSSVAAVRWWVLGYIAATMGGGVLFGPRWFDRADPFDVYSSLVAHASPLVRDGRWAPHNPLRTLAAIRPQPGLVPVVAILMGSTAFDSFTVLPLWQDGNHGVVVASVVLVGFCAVVAALFALASIATGGVSAATRRALPGLYAHSLLPIAIGYVLAHYLTALLDQGPQILGLASSVPLEATLQLAVVKVGLVVLGHLVAILAAHDCALRVLPKAHRLAGQLAMLLLMVAYTFVGLLLLLAT